MNINMKRIICHIKMACFFVIINLLIFRINSFKYYKAFNLLSKSILLITDEGFREIIQRIEVYNHNEIDEKSDYLIELIDYYGHNQIRFSDVVDVFDNEIIFDNDTGEKIKVLDKIASRI